jgi:hypothetical protein
MQIPSEINEENQILASLEHTGRTRTWILFKIARGVLATCSMIPYSRANNEKAAFATGGLHTQE